MTGRGRAWLAATGIAVTCIGAPAASPATAGLATPHAVTPRAGFRVQSLPQFGWSGVRGADHYEFAIAADSSFNSPLLGGDGDFTTQSTRATIQKTVANGTYYWHVRAISSSGAVSGWSPPQRLVKAWTTKPELLVPRNGSRVSFPIPLVLTWRPVPGAATYRVSIATDPGLGSLVGDGTIETSAAALTPAVALHVGTYYWAVTPVDSEGNPGARSKVHSFQWAWPTIPSNLIVSDLIGPNDVTDPAFGSPFDTALFLPQFKWSAVPGATRYELEINSDQSWAAGSRVCCDNTIIAPVYTPTVGLKSNRYFWRVRAFDAQGNAGAWSPAGEGTTADSFVQTFDNVCTSGLPASCVPAPGPSIHNFRVEDWTGANVTHNSTSSPIVAWDAVPGASSYEYDVTRYHDGSCDFTWGGQDHWRGVTATPAWTPLGNGQTGVKPYPDNAGVSADSSHPVIGAHYCVRVRAQTSPDNGTYGDYTTVVDAFTFAGSSPGVVAALGAGDYLAPGQGESLRQMPVFRWRPVAGAQSYWLIVARDPSFTNIIDYVFTQMPVYAPRTGNGITTYADETTTYYWVVLPAANPDGTGASGDPVGAPGHGTFQKQVPPSDLKVSLDQVQPVFDWKPVAGARQYDIEVASDPNFGNILEKAQTVSTSYTAAVTYPPGKKLYWHVRADDAQSVGLSWAASDFRYALPVPGLSGNARSGDMIPVWHWKAVRGATSYDVHVDGPNGYSTDFNGLTTAAIAPTQMPGTGIYRWRVRANFPNAIGSSHGPYSRPLPFARTYQPPSGAHSIGSGATLVLLWRPKVAAKQYNVQIAKTPDFGAIVEQVTTENPIYAPQALSSSYSNGGTFYWRVSAADANGSSGDSTATHTFRLSKRR